MPKIHLADWHAVRLVGTGEVARTDLNSDYGHPAGVGDAVKTDRPKESPASQRIADYMRQGPASNRLHDDGGKSEDPIGSHDLFRDDADGADVSGTINNPFE